MFNVARQLLSLKRCSEILSIYCISTVPQGKSLVSLLNKDTFKKERKLMGKML